MKYPAAREVAPPISHDAAHDFLVYTRLCAKQAIISNVYGKRRAREKNETRAWRTSDDGRAKSPHIETVTAVHGPVRSMRPRGCTRAPSGRTAARVACQHAGGARARA